MPFERVALIYRLLSNGLALARIRPSSSHTVADLIETQAAERSAHPFVLFEDRRISYADYNAMANRIAHWGVERGFAPGETVALLMHNRPEFLEVWAGMTKLGVTTALLNTNLSGRALAHAIESASPICLIVGEECLPALATLDAAPELETWVLGEQARPLAGGADRDLGAALGAQSSDNPDAALRRGVQAGDDLFYIYTSGTTGLPKAARFSHLRFFSASAPGRIGGFGRTDTMYCALPLYHSAGGAMAVGMVLGAGGTLALARKFSASGFWNDVRRYDASAFQYIGEFCRYLLNQPTRGDDRDHSVRLAVGNGLRPDIWETFRDRFGVARILEFYGATEGNVAMLNLDNKVGSVGRIPSRLLMDARIIRYDVESDSYPRDAQGRCIECRPDEVGELIGRMPASSSDSRGRFEGYTSEEATRRKVLRDVFSDGDAWFRTGDLLRKDRKGYYYFVDRIGDTFRWKGENVSTQEVAEAVGCYPGVEMTSVYGVELPGADGRAGMAALVRSGADSFDGAAFYRFVADSLPAYAAPVFVRLQQEADVTGTFKLRKVELQAEGYDSERIKDPLYVRDDAARAYLPLDRERLELLLSGTLRV